MCQIGRDYCDSMPCQHLSECKKIGNGNVGYVCECLDGFEGSHCEVVVNECLSGPCLNGGSCMDGPGKFMCYCEPGFTGI